MEKEEKDEPGAVATPEVAVEAITGPTSTNIAACQLRSPLALLANQSETQREKIPVKGCS